jgi:L-ascorbate metabolism protein UlaG (beta-lactamase superfamily)
MNIQFWSIICIALSIAALAAGCATNPTSVPTPTATLKPVLTPANSPAPTTAVIPATRAPENTPSAAPVLPLIGMSVSVTWYGQSTFVISGSNGFKALLDPTGSGTGYKIPTIEGTDVVTASHEHTDHNAVSLASGNPTILKGLTGNEWSNINQLVKGVKIRTVGTFHDDNQGAQRGKNSIFIFDLDGIRIAHAGDLGHKLSSEQAAAIGPIEILLLPVGGYYTIDAKTANDVVRQLNPKIVVPMHYKTADVSSSLASVLAPVTEFTVLMKDMAAIIESSQTITIEKGKLPGRLTIYVMKYK